MKRFIKAIALIPILLLASCQEKVETEQGTMKSVDLRYRCQDSYELTASSAAPIVIVVRSLYDPWTVRSYHPDWCTIDVPAGDADVKQDVTIQYADNPELDDRVDTLEIKSDYWVGKLVTVTQKGIAFLTGPDPSVLSVIPKEGGDASFPVNANQDWSAKVTSGSDWMSIKNGEIGSMSGTVTVTAKDNPGEMRYGVVTLYDRHGVSGPTVKITQNGVQLDPATYEIHAAYDQAVYELEIVSNATWKAEKTDEDTEWYSFENPENTGNATLRIKLNPNLGTSLKRDSLYIRTVAGPGEPVVSRTVVIKQAFEQIPEKHIFDATEYGKWKSDKGVDPVLNADGSATFGAGTGGYARLNRNPMPCGTYTWRWKDISADARIRLWICYSGGQEVKFNLKGSGSTECSTSPSDVGNNYFTNVSGIDMTVPHEMSFVLTDNGDGYTRVALALDGVEINSFISSETEMNGIKWNATINMYFGCETGSAVCEWYSYLPPFSWD